MQIKLNITYDDVNNTVKVEGPIDHKTVCFGILESAKDAIREHNTKNANGVIQASPEMAAALQTNTKRT